MVTVDPGLVYACITHVPLWLELPPWVVALHLGDAQGEGRLNLRDVAPDWVHPRLGISVATLLAGLVDQPIRPLSDTPDPVP